MEKMTDRKAFLAAAATAAGATGVIASQRPANALGGNTKFAILRAVTQDELHAIEWHLNHGFSVEGFAFDSGNAGWVFMVNLVG